MPKGLKHSDETKLKISEAAIRTMCQPNAGFRQRVSCDLCGSSMSPANLGKHYARCKETRGIFLNGVELTVKEIAALRKCIKSAGWTVEEYVKQNNAQSGLCAICLKPPAKNRLYADHCHVSQKPRGLLCESCNFAIGLFKDDVESIVRAGQYLLKYNHD